MLGALSSFPEPASPTVGTYYSAAADDMHHVSFGFICVLGTKIVNISCLGASLVFPSWPFVLWHFSLKSSTLHGEAEYASLASGARSKNYI